MEMGGRSRESTRLRLSQLEAGLIGLCSCFGSLGFGTRGQSSLALGLGVCLTGKGSKLLLLRCFALEILQCLLLHNLLSLGEGMDARASWEGARGGVKMLKL
jgi:hypothetical protein